MTDKYNDLNGDLTNMQAAPPPWLLAMRETELSEIARKLAAALYDMADAAARALAETAIRLDCARQTYVSSYEGRRLRRALRSLGLLAPPPAPVSRYKAHGRRRSRRERRDIRRQRD